ncbi:hypothetical protein ACLQ2Q_13400 [Microbacterium sp. DT81.1]|uniref:hypothetical protein n=1 Tax=Microbacterium sp. DT81.1 TaxID=3393413 RepID=UPI003CF9BC09
MANERQTFYVHFPELSIPAPLSVLGGTLREVGFEEYAPLDNDWASERYYRAHQRVFWVVDTMGRSDLADFRVAVESGDLDRVRHWYREQEDYPDELLDSVTERAELLHLAIVCASAELLVSPSLSMLYRTPASGGVSRRVGLAHRTWVLALQDSIRISAESLAAAAEMVSRWVAAGLESDHVLLGPLRTVSSVAGGALSAGAIVTLLVVALESSLNFGGTDGKRARPIAADIRERMIAAGSADIGSRMKPLYAHRSDFLHGRREPLPLEADIVLLVSLLTASVASRTLALQQPEGEGLGA